MKQEANSKVIWFLVYAFGIPLICVLLMENIVACKNGMLNLLLYGIEGASPFLAAIFVVLHAGGGTGLKSYLTKKYRVSFHKKYILFAFLIPFTILTSAKAVTYLMSINNQMIRIPSSRKLLIISFALIAEELGWRGYLQEKIESKIGEIFTPFVVGIIWTLWHYHFFLLGTMEIPIIIFAYGCIAESYGYFVITKLSNGNVIPASIWHFVGNLFFNLYLFDPKWNNGNTLPYIIASVFYSLNIVIFILYRKREKKNTALFNSRSNIK